MTQHVPEGWYVDPQGGPPGAERWWNGYHWTAHTRINPTPPPGPDLAAAASAAPSAAERPAGKQRQATLPDGTPLAEVGPRLVAYGLDVVLLWFVSTVFSGIVSLGFGLATWTTGLSFDFFLFGLDQAIDVLVLAVLWLGYQVLFLRSGGATLGKRLLGIQVRRLEGSDPLTASEALRRGALGGAGALFWLFPGSQLLGVLLGGYDAYRMSDDPRRRAWHDQVVGTVVVKRSR